MDNSVKAIAEKASTLKKRERQLNYSLKLILDEIERVNMEQLHIKHILDIKLRQANTQEVIEESNDVPLNLDDHLSINKQQIDLDVPSNKTSKTTEEEEDSD